MSPYRLPATFELEKPAPSKFRAIMIGLCVILMGHALGYALSGCLDARSVDAVNSPSDDEALKRCRNVARSEVDAGRGGYIAYDAYYACTKDAGLR